MSSFSGIELGKRGILAHSRSINTIGHNLTNQATEGYTRQEVRLGVSSPIYKPSLNSANSKGQLGQGTQAVEVKRIKDELLESRIIEASNEEGYWNTRDKYILMLEQVYNEPEETSLRNTMDRFWDSFQDLSLFPDQMATRYQVNERAKTLVDNISKRYKQFDTIRKMTNQDLTNDVKDINRLTKEIARLNKEIISVNNVKNNPNDSLDRRDNLVNKLGQLIPVTIDTRGGLYNIHSKGNHLVVGAEAREIVLKDNAANEGYPDLYWKDNNTEANLTGGKLGALFDLRDNDIKYEIQALDNMVINFTSSINSIHKQGYALNSKTDLNFFNEHTFVNNVNGNYDRNQDGVDDSSYIFSLLGENTLDPQDQIGFNGTLTLPSANTTIQVNYYETDTIRDIILRVNNSDSDIVASLDKDNRLILKGTPSSNDNLPDFVLRSFSDSNDFLTGYSGILNGSGGGSYDWQVIDAVNNLKPGASYNTAPLNHPSSWLSINKDILKDPSNIAASVSTSLGDGNIALDIASIRNNDIMIGKFSSFDDYFSDSVALIASKGEEAFFNKESRSQDMKELRDTRDSISGVNIDEEIANLVKYQHGYNASARFISTIDSMLDTIINRLGS